MERTEDEKAVLDEKLRLTYFQPDGKKNGGAYVTVLSAIKKLDPLEGRLVLADGTAIPIEDIWGIQDGSGDRLFGEETL